MHVFNNFILVVNVNGRSSEECVQNMSISAKRSHVRTMESAYKPKRDIGRLCKET